MRKIFVGDRVYGENRGCAVLGIKVTVVYCRSRVSACLRAMSFEMFYDRLNIIEDLNASIFGLLEDTVTVNGMLFFEKANIKMEFCN